MIENIIDLGDLRVRDAMRGLADVQVIRLDRPWEENMRVILGTRFSRYPLVAQEGTKPIGVIHLKNLFLANPAGGDISPDQLKRLAQPCLEIMEDSPLEEALARFQGLFVQMAIVVSARGEWTGILTIEDVLEELVGGMGDEFDLKRAGQPISLADALTPGRVVFELQADSMSVAIRQIITRIPRKELPFKPQAILREVQQRQPATLTYAGRGLAIQLVRLDGISKPLLAFARSDEGIPVENTNERAQSIFLVLTPSRMARVRSRLLAEIADLFESEYLIERLRHAKTPEEVIEAIRAGQQVVGD